MSFECLGFYPKSPNVLGEIKRFCENFSEEGIAHSSHCCSVKIYMYQLLAVHSTPVFLVKAVKAAAPSSVLASRFSSKACCQNGGLEGKMFVPGYASQESKCQLKDIKVACEEHFPQN